jgi:DNA-binding MarR family transcriptional regulator
MGSHTPRRPARQQGVSPPIHDDVRSVLNALRRIVRTLRVSARSAEQRVGLSGAQLFVLQCLARQSPCSVNELSRYTATDQSSVSVVVTRLVNRGLVSRTTSKTDRRSVRLALTAAGRALSQSAPEAAQERLLGALLGLAPKELGALSQTLGKVVALAEASTEQASLFFEEEPHGTRAKRLQKAGAQ